MPMSFWDEQHVTRSQNALRVLRSRREREAREVGFLDTEATDIPLGAGSTTLTIDIQFRCLVW